MKYAIGFHQIGKEKGRGQALFAPLLHIHTHYPEMASIPSQPPAPQRQDSSHHRTPSPTARRPSRSSQSLTSEDSQTVLIGTPTSSSPKTQSPSPTPATPGPTAAEPESEPRKCWICFSDETEDTPLSSEWVSPCPCALTAHQACLLDWVADLKAPNRKNAQKVQCPQCKANIRLSQPQSVSVEILRASERVHGKLRWFVLGGIGTSALVGGTYIIGLMSVIQVVGLPDAMRLVEMGNQNGAPNIKVISAIPFVPVVLALSRTTLADGILPLLPMAFLFGRPRPTRNAPLWPPSAMMTLCALPYIRAIYNGFHKTVIAPREKAWLQQIQPRAAENADGLANGDAVQGDNDMEGQDENNVDDMLDFELGVQVEVIEEEEEIEPQHQPNNAPAQAQPRPQNEGNNDQDHGPNQPQAPPQPAPVAGQPQEFRQNIFLNLAIVTHSITGAILFPTISMSMGYTLKVLLPSHLTTLPMRSRWSSLPAKPTGLLQTRWGRSLVGGLLFVVLKDALSFWARWSLKNDHKKRKVLNHGEASEEDERPWWKRPLLEMFR